MKIRSRIIKETSIRLTEKDAEKLLMEFRQMRDRNVYAGDVPLIRAIIGNLVGEIESVDPTYLN